MAKNTTTTGYSLPPRLVERIAERAEEAEMTKSEMLATDVEAYYGILEYGLGKARLDLSAGEASVILSAVTNPSLNTGQDAVRWMTTNLIYAVQDAIEMESAAEYQNVDGKDLLDKLGEMPEFARLSLVYWARMMWCCSDKSERWSVELGRFKG